MPGQEYPVSEFVNRRMGMHPFDMDVSRMGLGEKRASVC
jgi:hypothetical protein